MAGVDTNDSVLEDEPVTNSSADRDSVRSYTSDSLCEAGRAREASEIRSCRSVSPGEAPAPADVEKAAEDVFLPPIFRKKGKKGKGARAIE
jgi:hypothetical protein